MSATDKLPDFIIIGAMKSGTSTLQDQLVRQSGVFMTDPKEPNFFSDDDIYAKGMDWYQSLYNDAAVTDLTGEASTHYTKLPTYPETVMRLKAVVPNPKLIYVIRNPVRRAVSHFIHGWTQGEFTQDALTTFKSDPTLAAYGRYAYQLAPFVEAFGLENIHLTSLEQIKTTPDEELEKIARFLGHEGGFSWDHDQAPQNVSAERIRKLPLHGLLVENPIARKLRHWLVPQAIRTKIREARTFGEPPELPDDLISELEAAFLEDRKALSKLFPDHAALNLCYPFASTD